MRDKITPDINAHFGYDLDKTVDFFTLSRDDFLSTYPSIDEVTYNNTIIFWLNRINMIDNIYKTIGQIDGIYLAKLYRLHNIDPLDLFILCS